MKRSVVALVLTLLLGTACGNLFDPAAAVVEGEKITIAKLEAKVEEYRETARYQALVAQPAADADELERTFQQEYLSLLIREAILENEAEQRDIEVTPDEVNERIDQIRERFGSQGRFQEALKEDGLTVEDLEFRVRVVLLEEKLRAEVTEGVGPTEEEMRAYYEEHVDDYQEVHAQHILLDAKKLSLAEDLSLQLQKAKPEEMDDLFASLAEKHSEDPSTSGDGGDLGWARPSQYAGTFAEAIGELEVGEVSEPVKTEFGWHVIRLIGRRVTPFEEARTSIQEAIGGEAVEEAWEEWLLQTFGDADIKVNEKFGVFDADSLTVRNPDADDVPGAEAPALESPSPEPSL